MDKPVETLRPPWATAATSTSPPPGFTECYSVRSVLAHGHLNRPHPTDVDRYAAHLEGFVSDLLARPLLDQVPRFQLGGPGRALWDAAVTAARDVALEQNP